jgi:hypothetical protein
MEMLLGVLPKQDMDNSFDFVFRPSFGRAILIKGTLPPSTSMTAVSELLAAAETSKANRMTMYFNLAMQFWVQKADQEAKLSAQKADQEAKLSAQKADQKAKLSAQKAKLSAEKADQKAKLSAQRYAQFMAIVDRAARWREEASVLRAQRIAGQAMVRTRTTPTRRAFCQAAKQTDPGPARAVRQGCHSRRHHRRRRSRPGCPAAPWRPEP